MQHLKQTLPLALIAVFFGGVHLILFVSLTDAVEVSPDMQDVIGGSQWGGPEILFVLNAAAFAWVSIFAIRRRISTSGWPLMLGVAAIAAAFLGLASYFGWRVSGSSEDAMWRTYLFALAAALAVTVIRELMDI